MYYRLQQIIQCHARIHNYGENSVIVIIDYDYFLATE
jgi:hypothetical protein